MRVEQLLRSARLRLSDRLKPWPRRWTVGRPGESFVVECRSRLELGRARSFEQKEPGTVAWIRGEVRPGDVFVDVGANMGLYSLLAARRCGPTGVVYAFEPHLINAGDLLTNVTINGLAGLVQVLSCALHDREGFLPFECSSLEPGTSFHQVREEASLARAASGGSRVSELKYATALDTLVERRIVRTPDHIKIDVDGNEPHILRGMARLLGGPSPPRSIQVEADHDTASTIRRTLDEFGYRRVERHDTAHGAALIAGGADPASVAHNLLFRRD